MVFDSERLTDRMNTLHRVLLAAALTTLAYNATYGAEIINGKKAKKNSMQYMASVQDEGKHKCGGFLIDAGYVLTAAHCYSPEKNMSVVLGTQNISGKKLNRYAVERAHKPLSYKTPESGDDIMLLKLSSKVKLNKSTKTIKIPTKDKAVKAKTKCQVAGWGMTENQTMSKDLLVADISTINLKDCQDVWKKVNVKLPSNVICAGGYKTEKGACKGDSGGPLVCKGEAVGVVSFNLSENCRYPNVPNIYTQISKHAAWIKKIIKKGD